MNLKVRIIKSEFVKNILTLISGVAVAQIIPILLSPILTRIYSPEDFGLLGLYTAVTMAVSVFATGRFDLAILQPKHDYEAKFLVYISLFLALIFSTFLFIIIVFFNAQITSVLGNSRIGNWLYLVPISVLLISTVSVLYYWLNRKKLFKERGVSRVVSSSTITITSLFVGFVNFLKFNGLIAGTLLGQFLNIIYLKRYISFKNFNFTKKKAKVIILKYKEYPQFLMLSTFLEKIAVNLPTILFTSYFGLVVTGFYALSERIIGSTIALLGQVIGEVYRQKASEDFQKFGNCKHTFVATFKRLVVIGFVFFGGLFLLSEWFFSFVFGKEWLIAGTITKYLSFSIFFQFLSTPLAYTIVFNKSQQIDTILQFFRTSFSFLAIYIGYKYDDFIISIKLYSLVYSIYYICHSIVQYRSAAGYSRITIFKKN
ncbi:polysaccharide biosynthesis protein [Polaribacter pacificus]|uniref:Polysaccharide biosynthesis protein n=1 Tax=Polaribacter pacificus TaxID=1775173 RepID=A0A917MF81_9FLAO|nr:oligosaccharide flippase family protein [Polaribacter pacificus]GGH01702.1 polysaccharide biosynthesis protein [Polaribacter pacificus]